MKREGLTMLRTIALGILVGSVATALGANARAPSAARPVDPGVRGGPPSAGEALPGLTSDEARFFQDGLTRFQDVEVVTGGDNNGLGPRFNSNQCSSCHLQHAVGGTSPASNPLIAVAKLNGAKNTLPWFITNSGPIREARFKRNPTGTPDGGVHASLDALTRQAATSPSQIFDLLEIQSPDNVEIATSFFAFRRLCLALGSSRRSPTRRS
jgi:hypothetical protein